MTTGNKYDWRVRLGLIASSLILAGLASGCAQDMDDLEQKVAKLEARPGGKIEPIPEMKPLPKYAYSVPADARTPFMPPEDDSVERRDGLTPDVDRPKEPLEQFPLDALAMRGIITRQENTFALIRDGNGVIHEVAPGEHMGRNYGEVIEIGETSVTLEEIVPDGQGGWRKQTTVVKSQSGRS
ncbi:pilus assembly protein PilP [Guyparkeria sp. 1SP6A2]|nr:pilus assembly protein PilP [Guyparkeria sp. 1SP6A2]